MKIFKKTYYMLKFYIMYFYKIRGTNLKIHNYANMITLNPKPEEVKIPKLIWLYWEGDVPLFVEKCIENIKLINANYEVHFLTPTTVDQFIQIDFDSLNIHLPQHKADLIRFKLLYVYGGIWLDASIIVYENLDWIQELVSQNQTESFAYYRKKNTTNIDSPVIENWLLATTPNNRFFKDWFDELVNAMQVGPKTYINEIKRAVPNYERIFQKISNLEYLISYVVCQVIMLKALPSITLIDCDQNAFYYQVKNKWVKEKTLIEMAINHHSGEYPKLIKFAGKERKHIGEFYEKGMYFQDSLLDFHDDQSKTLS